MNQVRKRVGPEMEPLGFDCMIMAPDILRRRCGGAGKKKGGTLDVGLGEAGEKSSVHP